MAIYGKGNSSGLLGKKGDYSGRVLGGVKGVSKFLNDPLVVGLTSLVAPELGAGLGAAKKLGVLEKISKM